MPEPVIVRLSDIQTLGIKLLGAREVIKSKNTCISQLQEDHKRRTIQDAQRIADLEVQIAELTTKLCESWSRDVDIQNELLCRDLALPGEGITLSLGQDGNYFYEAEPETELVPEERHKARSPA